MPRQVKITVLTVLVLVAAGAALGLLWALVSPDVPYVIIDGKPEPVDPEEPALIGFDGVFALIAMAAGLISGIVAHLLAGRRPATALLAGLIAGAPAASLTAWQTGRLAAHASYRHALRSAAEGAVVLGPADLRAYGVLLLWPLLAVGVYGLLEALRPYGVAARAQQGEAGQGAWDGPPAEGAPIVSGAGDGSTRGPGQPDQIGGGELDLQASPAGGHIDGDQPRR